MLDPKRIREDSTKITENLSRRTGDYQEKVQRFLEVDKKKRLLQQELEKLRKKRKERSRFTQTKEITEKITEKITEETKTSAKNLNKLIQDQQRELLFLENEIKELLLGFPNLVDDSVPTGQNELSNKVIKTSSTQTALIKKNKSHEQIGKELGIIDFEFTAKFSGARFSTFLGLGAKLERALINFMLDRASTNGYLELATPCIVKGETLVGTGQLPKFAEDLYKLEKTDHYLIPTAEVTLTSFFAQAKFIDLALQKVETSLNDETCSVLPKRLCAYTPCFRREAGSAGKDTSGIIRQHQFDKIELVHICKAEESKKELELLSNQVEGLLEDLELPYRKVLLCSGDLGFAASKCYDFEVWMPSQNSYREISSCSNCTDFQSRRFNLKYKNPQTNKLELLHTLNGSALAVGRAWAAILENHQITKNNKTIIKIPKVLQKYIGLDFISG